MLKIDNLNELKITSITAGVHFKYKDKFYFVHSNNEEGVLRHYMKEE